MKKLYLTILAILTIVQFSYGQWTGGPTGNVYYNGGNIGIGTTNPTTALQLGEFNGSPNQLLIPGTYNFEQVRLGQISNGNSALEFVNHNGGLSSYGIKFLVDVDHGLPGFQLQYAQPSTSYSSLNYVTGLYLNLSGNIGIGTTNPNAPLHVYAGSNNSIITGLKLQGGEGSTSSGSSLLFASSYAVTDYQTGRITAITTGWGTDFKSDLAFYSNTGANGGNLTEKMRITSSGNVGIGTADPQGYKLAVNGSAIAESVTIKLHTNWPDYVFKKEYKLPSLLEVKAYIDQNNHLPDMPSEQDVKDNGLNLGEINKTLTKKVEELTLYLIDKDKQLTEQQKQINELKEQVNAIISKQKATIK